MPDTTIILAIIAILIGLIGCFYGYPLFRIYLILIGLIVGYQLGLRIAPPDQPALALAAGIIAAVALALLAYPLWSIGILVAGAVLGFSLGTLIGQSLNLDPTVVLIIGIIGAVLLGILFFSARDLVAMLATAFNGAALIVYGLGLLLPFFSFEVEGGNVVALIVIIILGIVGFAAQYGQFRDRRLYSRTVG